MERALETVRLFAEIDIDGAMLTGPIDPLIDELKTGKFNIVQATEHTPAVFIFNLARQFPEQFPTEHTVRLVRTRGG